MTARAPLRLQIPAEVWERIGQNGALAADLAAGPSHIMRGRQVFRPPATVERACAWLERYQAAIKACSILVEDRSVIWFSGGNFLRHDHDDTQLRQAGAWIDTLKDEKAGISMSARVTEKTLCRPFDRCYWVADGKLLAGFYPGHEDTSRARDQISRIIDFGVTHFVNLMEEDERNYAGQKFRPYDDMAKELAAERGVAVTRARFPVPDMDVPSPAVMMRILDSIDAAASAGRITYVHCLGGMGRTGAVVGCWLARHGTSGGAALERITELREVIPEDLRGDSPQTGGQRKMVLSWKDGGMDGKFIETLPVDVQQKPGREVRCDSPGVRTDREDEP